LKPIWATQHDLISRKEKKKERKKKGKKKEQIWQNNSEIYSLVVEKK
jgi:hypothetical protein